MHIVLALPPQSQMQYFLLCACLDPRRRLKFLASSLALGCPDVPVLSENHLCNTRASHSSILLRNQLDFLFALSQLVSRAMLIPMAHPLASRYLLNRV